MEKQIVKSDFLIIGSGLAGLTSAIYASEYGSVNLVSKSKFNISSTYWAQGELLLQLINQIHQKYIIKIQLLPVVNYAIKNG